MRERFSARHFWNDIVEQRCTLFQYIGELCRYLVNGAPQPQEKRHALRLACGNGLRRRRLERVSAALPHSADSRVLRRHRRQLLAL